MFLERIAKFGLVGAIDASVRIDVGVFLQMTGQHRFADARVRTFLALERFGAVVNAQPMVIHVMLILGNEGTLGTSEALDMAAHVLPVFHLGNGHVTALFAGFTFSVAFHLLLLDIILPIETEITKTDGRSVDRVHLALRASSQHRGDRILLDFGAREMRKTRDPGVRIVALQCVTLDRAIGKFQSEKTSISGSHITDRRRGETRTTIETPSFRERRIKEHTYRT